MKIILNLLFVLVLMFTFSCKNETESSTEINREEPINIEFIKQGELSLINNDSIIKKLDIELAKTDNKRAIGLMNRNSLEENQGMLFVFQEDNMSGFYMKDTRISLDIIYLGEDSTVISISKNRQPFDLKSEGAASPYRYVLEVNGGMSDAWGIKEGVTKINWTENL